MGWFRKGGKMINTLITDQVILTGFYKMPGNFTCIKGCTLKEGQARNAILFVDIFASAYICLLALIF